MATNIFKFNNNDRILAIYYIYSKSASCSKTFIVFFFESDICEVRWIVVSVIIKEKTFLKL